MESLARNDSSLPISLKFLADRSGMTLKFLQAVAGDLTKAGLIQTRVGSKGGVQLSKKSEEISLLQIIEAVEGKINIMSCLHHPKTCQEFKSCSIMKVLFDAQDAFVQRLANSSLKLMVSAQIDPFNRVPAGHFQKPSAHCPVLK